ncbi:MAG: DUF3551 domain-containing protein [Alphaproteobacteria bacterium]|nr:MAG: DUF3551 domain-containing protein [Alphaproteobacteria bacterium]
MARVRPHSLGGAGDRDRRYRIARIEHLTPPTPSRALRAGTEALIRALTALSIALGALSLAIDGAHAAPWCANYGFRTNCGFHTFAQCMATVSGNAGFCLRNQFENPSSLGKDVRRRSPRDE